MILIVDNYDSFTYNLYQYIGETNPDLAVYRNDRIAVSDILRMNPSHIVLSPGPGFPGNAGICIDVIRQLGSRIPILGVCLGHQAIGEAYGGKVVHAPYLMHGKVSSISLDADCCLFKGLPGQITAGRYHSLVVERDSLPGELKVTAWTDDGLVMAVEHRTHPVYGIQFHPESILTPDGKSILKNFLSRQKTACKK